MYEHQDGGHGQHDREGVTPGRNIDDHGARSEKDEKCCPYEFERAIHTHYVAEQKEVGNCKDHQDAETLIDARHDVRTKETQDQYPTSISEMRKPGR